MLLSLQLRAATRLCSHITVMGLGSRSPYDHHAPRWDWFTLSNSSHFTRQCPRLSLLCNSPRRWGPSVSFPEGTGAER